MEEKNKKKEEEMKKMIEQKEEENKKKEEEMKKMKETMKELIKSFYPNFSNEEAENYLKKMSKGKK